MAEKKATEAALIRAMQRGEEQALERVIEQYTPYVSAIVLNIVSRALDRADAAAVVSDVFYTLWVNAKKIQRGKLKGYLCSIARSKALNAVRSAGQELPLEEDMIHISAVSPDEEAEKREEYEALRRALSNMPEPDKTIFIRRYYLYQKVADIARVMGINENTVQTKLRRGRESLRRELERGGF